MTDSAPLTYWATVAQVIPVAALAVVVEARALSGRWGNGTPALLRVFQGAAWGGVLIVLAFGETQALAGVQGQRVASWGPTLCSGAIGAALGLLFVSPALEVLVRANAGSLGLLLTLHPKFQLERWRLQRRLRGIRQDREKQFDRMRELLQERVHLSEHGLECISAAEREFAEQFGEARRDLDPQQRAERTQELDLLEARTLESLNEWRTTVSAAREEAFEELRHLGRIAAERGADQIAFDRSQQELLARFEEVNRKEREDLASHLLRFPEVPRAVAAPDDVQQSQAEAVLPTAGEPSSERGE